MVSERLLFAFSPILNFLSLTQCTAPCHRQNAPSSSTVCTGEEFLTRSSQTGGLSVDISHRTVQKFPLFVVPEDVDKMLTHDKVSHPRGLTPGTVSGSQLCKLPLPPSLH
ncbi:unnamed protein product [Musa acuminata subsp. malaccensis]|uniref:(wild Malaysian banana) hypothetical protein n=1 Tax=Musa acuminata subsp. malaccensis TaxID=214687 RepID=A0A804K2L1_MUSAM|nr:unnamed protein product [Musa acuminata subsp. malaccensis]